MLRPSMYLLCTTQTWTHVVLISPFSGPLHVCSIWDNISWSSTLLRAFLLWHLWNINGNPLLVGQFWWWAWGPGSCRCFSRRKSVSRYALCLCFYCSSCNLLGLFQVWESSMHPSFRVPVESFEAASKTFPHLPCSYYFVSDAVMAITKTDNSRDAARPWAKVFLGSLTGLSILQVIWLGQIVMVAKEEISKMYATE